MPLLKLITVPAIWGASLLGALSLHHVTALDGPSVCGPWGCGAPTSALISLHTSWAVALWPLLGLAARHGSVSRVKRLSQAIMGLGIAGLLFIVLWQVFSWWPQQSEYMQGFLLQRCGFVIVTTTDWPFMQLLSGGSVLLLWQRWKNSSTPVHSDDALEAVSA
ncbi:MAG: hypothetical protein NXI04_02715 [Planctomycetaceae bacterium]|nr:hypothetical protein [Planctomycetaceae bacterium]